MGFLSFVDILCLKLNSFVIFSEFVKNVKQIFPFQCSKKEEFIKKGTGKCEAAGCCQYFFHYLLISIIVWTSKALYNAKNKFMEKFPSDVEVAERLTRKVIETALIINDRPNSIVKAILGQTLTRRSKDYYDNDSSSSLQNFSSGNNSSTDSGGGIRRSGVSSYQLYIFRINSNSNDDVL